MANQSSAYNFELFEPNRKIEQEPPRKTNVIELPKEQLEANRHTKVRPFRLVAIFAVFAIIAGIVAAYVNGQVQLSQLSNEMGTAQKTLQEQQDLTAQLKIKSDSKLSMEAVENRASQNLGMQKTTRSQITTVALSKGDRSEVVGGTQNKNWLERAWEAVKGFLS